MFTTPQSNRIRQLGPIGSPIAPIGSPMVGGSIPTPSFESPLFGGPVLTNPMISGSVPCSPAPSTSSKPYISYKPIYRQDQAIVRNSYSSKVFIGAVPPGTNERSIARPLKEFGELEITWPNKAGSIYPAQGYVFVIFKNADSVNSLLTKCITEEHGKFLFHIPDINTMVQVRPFALNTASLIIDPLWFRFVRLSVFVGGLPRSCSARDLAVAIVGEFGPILHSSIELDYFHSYPKGAARVVFRNVKDYMKAAHAGHVVLEIAGNSHRVELKPFFYHGIGCEICFITSTLTDYFCTTCLKYLCKSCWSFTHKSRVMATHLPLKDSKRDLPASCRNAAVAVSAGI